MFSESKTIKHRRIYSTKKQVIVDLGTIVVIAIFYSTSLAYINLLIAFALYGFLFILNRLKVHNLIPYLFGGVVMWYFMLHSGIHAAITGVLLAFVIPIGDDREKSPSFILQHFLHKPVAFLILPLFAIANTCISVENNWQSFLVQSNNLGIIAGLVIGKPLGIWLFSYICVSIGLCKLPADLKWKNIIGAGILGGIGFTMSLFITFLAFDKPDIVNNSKIAVLIASLIASTIGLIWLKLTLKPQNNIE